MFSLGADQGSRYVTLDSLATPSGVAHVNSTDQPKGAPQFI